MRGSRVHLGELERGPRLTTRRATREGAQRSAITSPEPPSLSGASRLRAANGGLPGYSCYFNTGGYSRPLAGARQKGKRPHQNASRGAEASPPVIGEGLVSLCAEADPPAAGAVIEGRQGFV
ncbi:hypothetical protein XAC3824_1400003 [Xanthomonas citri pv. citri]|nr:hypothetical protein XAC3824_1400003 [Xanthomonas citri pv. citri]CEE50798.1 hypothetical protein XAC71A_1130003 [Xanthomonas citri pv. citri]CEL35638.1 hypothetical protein XAC4311_2410001 [Xanthomonas citri pv. citri]CEL42799.1 hypothetical protein XAC439_11970001 [Xanthomonas citri pv. citri]